MPQSEIVLPETKPETEWVRGRALQKVSPQRTHSRLQGALTMRLDRWAAGRGEVGPEWRFRVAPPGEVRRPLVPDVAYVSNERIRPLGDDELEVPPLAPDVTVEAGDRRRSDAASGRAARPYENAVPGRRWNDRTPGLAGIFVSDRRAIRGASAPLIAGSRSSGFRKTASRQDFERASARF